MSTVTYMLFSFVKASATLDAAAVLAIVRGLWLAGWIGMDRS
jgi:hypothetical protein